MLIVETLLVIIFSIIVLRFILPISLTLASLIAIPCLGFIGMLVGQIVRSFV